MANLSDFTHDGIRWAKIEEDDVYERVYGDGYTEFEFRVLNLITHLVETWRMSESQLYIWARDEEGELCEFQGIVKTDTKYRSVCLASEERIGDLMTNEIFSVQSIKVLESSKPIVPKSWEEYDIKQTQRRKEILKVSTQYNMSCEEYQDSEDDERYEEHLKEEEEKEQAKVQPNKDEVFEMTQEELARTMTQEILGYMDKIVPTKVVLEVLGELQTAMKDEDYENVLDKAAEIRALFCDCEFKKGESPDRIIPRREYKHDEPTFDHVTSWESFEKLYENDFVRVNILHTDFSDMKDNPENVLFVPQKVADKIMVWNNKIRKHLADGKQIQLKWTFDKYAPECLLPVNLTYHLRGEVNEDHTISIW